MDNFNDRRDINALCNTRISFVALLLADYDVDRWYCNFESIGEHVDFLLVNCSSLPDGSTFPY